MSLILENARLVLRDDVALGWLAAEDGRIVEIGEGRAPERGVDCGGDTVVPGLVELHTDALEAHVQPRPMVRWNLPGAVQAYDAQIASAGITTVFDSLRVGTETAGMLGGEAAPFADAIAAAAAAGILRAEHLTHLRCEVCTPDVIDRAEDFLASRKAHLMSLMDHTPGQRQFRDVEKLLEWYRGKGRGEDELRSLMEEKQRLRDRYGVVNRERLTRIAGERGVALASHDDSTLAEVAESAAAGARLAEFPVTLEAAEACRAHGIAVLMGAPNLVRGGSHAGNVAAAELAAAGLLDILSSDYVPVSLMQAAVALPEAVPGISLAAAVRTVTAAPAAAAGLLDRGAIEIGLRADLARVRPAADGPAVRAVWRAGERVA
jgi:alpha-D-ribose 1-methylphosphonate 5-triphosphate diphosphatase